MWRSARDIEATLSDMPALPQLERFFALRTFWARSIYSKEYHAADIWSNVLVPTSEGADYLSILKEVQDLFPRSDFMLALFIHFCHHDIIFDWQRSDLQSIQALLEKELLEEAIRLPLRYGRLLYDRYNDANEEGIDELAPEGVKVLLEGTPQGVYQLGQLVSGPLGVLESPERRYVPPSRKLPLWHCSDTGCGKLHTVLLQQWGNAFVQACDTVSKTLKQSLGPRSDWDMVLSWLHRGPNPLDARAYIDLPVLLADCLIGSERTMLLEEALKDRVAQFLGEAISRSPRLSGRPRAPGQFAASLSPIEQLQVLLLLRDEDLVRLIDQAVDRRLIKIGLGEVRRATQSPPSLSIDSRCELSALGVRSSKDYPIVNLASTIWRAYNDTGKIGDLGWRLRGGTGMSLHDSLLVFIRNHGPYGAIRDLVLIDQDITSFLTGELRLMPDKTLYTGTGVLDRILWRLGFYPPQYDDFASRLNSRLLQFRDTVFSISQPRSEDDREKIRACGVNLFVSVEEFLDQYLVYSIWLLASDHFLGTRFRFNGPEARQSVADVLGPELRSDDMIVRWNPEGDNAIGVLLRYLSESVRWMQSLANQDKAAMARPEEDLPHYAGYQKRPFPFMHTALWADSDNDELRRFIEAYCQIAKLLEQANLAHVRNGLDHSRRDARFPDAEAMLTCAARLGEAFELADLGRYIPKVYWLQEVKTNWHGALEYVFEDYAQKRVVLNGPDMVSGLPDIDFEAPWLIAPGNLLGVANSHILFTVEETNEYTEHWRGYPRRRRIGPQSPTHDQDIAGTPVGGNTSVDPTD